MGTLISANPNQEWICTVLSLDPWLWSVLALPFSDQSVIEYHLVTSNRIYVPSYLLSLSIIHGTDRIHIPVWISISIYHLFQYVMLEYNDSDRILIYEVTLPCIYYCSDTISWLITMSYTCRWYQILQQYHTGIHTRDTK